MAVILMRRPGEKSTDYWLVALFALNAFTINVVGQWRYLELILVAPIFLMNQSFLRFVSYAQIRLLLLFLLTAAAQVICDYYTGLLTMETVRRSGTYVVMVFVIIAVLSLARNDPRRISLIVYGFCAATILNLFVGTNLNEAFALVPWRLGVGGAVTLLLCMVIAVSPTVFKFAGPALIGLSSVHIALDSRATAAIVALTGLLTMLAKNKRLYAPPKLHAPTIVAFIFLSLVAGFAVNFALKYATENKLFPSDELQAKMERQMAHPYGLLAAARPETMAALYAISQRPIFGWGSSASDRDVEYFYAEMVV